MTVLKKLGQFALLLLSQASYSQEGKYTSIAEALADPEKVTELQLSEITGSIPAEITRLKNLKVVRMINLQESYDLKDAFEKLSQINAVEEFYLYGNAHPRLPEEIKLFKNLKTIFLNEALKPALIETLHLLVKTGTIETLHLRGFSLVRLPDEIAGFTNLRSIDLGSNPKLNYEQAFGILSKLPKLENLNLDFNSFKTFPESIVTLKHLKRLQMEMMYAKFNVPRTYTMLAQMESLEELDISGNFLGSLPREIGMLTKLKVLDINGNGITDRELENLIELLPDTRILNDTPY